MSKIITFKLIALGFVIALTGCNDEGVSAPAPMPENFAPLVYISDAAPGADQATVSAFDESGIRLIELYINDRFVGSSTTSPHTFNWPKINGAIEIAAKATDIFGNSKTVRVRHRAPYIHEPLPCVFITQNYSTGEVSCTDKNGDQVT